MCAFKTRTESPKTLPEREQTRQECGLKAKHPSPRLLCQISPVFPSNFEQQSPVLVRGYAHINARCVISLALHGAGEEDSKHFWHFLKGKKKKNNPPLGGGGQQKRIPRRLNAALVRMYNMGCVAALRVQIY